MSDSTRDRDLSASSGAPLLAGIGNGTSHQELSNGGGFGDLTKTAKALYAYKASPDDPQELSFQKGEILRVSDDTGKWLYTSFQIS